MEIRNRAVSVCVVAVLAAPLLAARLSPPAPQWTQRSDAHSARVVALSEKLHPETATATSALDDQITDVSRGFEARARKSFQQLLHELRSQLVREEDPNVREDLEILVDHVENKIRASELESKFELPYIDSASTVLAGVSRLLADQIGAQRRPKALVRLRKYAGLEPGTRPLTTYAERRLREALSKSGLTAPQRSEVERDLAQANLILDEIGGLFQKYGIAGYEPAIAQLTQQITQYNQFIRAEVLPKCPIDRRLPPELYAFRMRDSYGVDISPSQLAGQARGAFRDTQAEMEALAAEIADTQHQPASDYRSVIRTLKKSQLHGDAIVAEYAHRLEDIEQIIVREKLLTLQPGKPRIRLATPAESAYYGVSPLTICPQLPNGEEAQCDTVLPLTLPTGSIGQVATVDDYTFAAASWTLAAHEIRPGHELQYHAGFARGLSVARRRIGVKLANPEGWAVYSESLIRPYMPPEARLISLQFLLLREARAFLDPELQAGTITSTDALNLLKNDVVLSDAFADSEMQRFAGGPGSGTSYFYGYSEFLRLRKDVQQALGVGFSQQEFHDFVLAQGKIPISMVRKAVFEHFMRSAAKG